MPRLVDIREVAGQLELQERHLTLHGRYRAKLDLGLLREGSTRRGKYVLVSAITPTLAGEGKTVTSIGLSMALSRLGRKAAVAIRQSALGPTFGGKGGGAGGGRIGDCSTGGVPLRPRR